jgi:hypothetical protein
VTGQTRNTLQQRTTCALNARFKIFTAVTVPITFFWIKSPCGLDGRNRRFGEAAVSIFRAEVMPPSSALKMETPRFSETLACPTNPHGDLTQKNIIRHVLDVQASKSGSCPLKQMRLYTHHRISITAAVTDSNYVSKTNLTVQKPRQDIQFNTLFCLL